MEFVTPPYDLTAWQGAVSLQLDQKILWRYVTRKDTGFVLKWLFEQTSSMTLKDFLIQVFTLRIWETEFSEWSENLIILHGTETQKIIFWLWGSVLFCFNYNIHLISEPLFISCMSLAFLRSIVALLNMSPHIIGSKWTYIYITLVSVMSELTHELIN
jgi:hypothetical protein